MERIRELGKLRKEFRKLGIGKRVREIRELGKKLWNVGKIGREIEKLGN